MKDPITLRDYDPKGTAAQEEAFEEWYKTEAPGGFVRKAAFLKGWDAAVFDMRRELDRLRADNAALRAVGGFPSIDDEKAWEAYMDHLATAVEVLGAEQAALHYAAAVAHWNQAIDRLNREK